MRPQFIDPSAHRIQMLVLSAALIWALCTLILYELLIHRHMLSMLPKVAVQPLARPYKHQYKNKNPLPLNEDYEELSSIGVLMIGCNRSALIEASLTQLINIRAHTREEFTRRYGSTALNASLAHLLRLPIVVSLDCGHEPTADLVRSLPGVDQILLYPEAGKLVPGLSRKERKLEGYYRISRHYRWALDEAFRQYDFQQLIVVEDDLNFSPDFFEYFLSLSPLLRQDPTLMCISAWNDNGKEGLINASDAALLYRTDFFPGLGWMLERSLWDGQLKEEWPLAFWDDWLRHWERMQNRTCIRPEISRTSTSGRKGVSHGQFYEQHLRYILHYQGYVPFFDRRHQLFAELSHVSYRRRFNETVYHEAEEISALALKYIDYKEEQEGRKCDNRPYRLIYHTMKEFQSYAKLFGLMSDFKHGIPRTSYQGVVSFYYSGHRIYLAPPPTFKTYIREWN